MMCDRFISKLSERENGFQNFMRLWANGNQQTKFLLIY